MSAIPHPAAPLLRAFCTCPHQGIERNIRGKRDIEARLCAYMGPLDALCSRYVQVFYIVGLYCHTEIHVSICTHFDANGSHKPGMRVNAEKKYINRLSHDIRWAGLIGGGFPAPRWPWGIKMLPPVSGSSAAPAAGPGAGAADTIGHLSLPQPNRAMAMGKPTDRAPQFRSRTGVGGVTDLKKRGLSKVS